MSAVLSGSEVYAHQYSRTAIGEGTSVALDSSSDGPFAARPLLGSHFPILDYR